MSERFFIAQPTHSGICVVPPSTEAPQGQTFNAYKATGIDHDMKWSGKMSLPSIGDRIYMRINSIGYGSVVGYCESHGFVGLLVKPENPPEWYVKQTKARVAETDKARKLGPDKSQIERIREWPQWIQDGIACVFGAEISL